MIDIAYFYQGQFDLFIARERNGVFGWKALVTSLLIVDIPSTMLAYFFSFLCYFWTMGIDTSSEAGGLTFLTWLGFSVFVVTSGVVSTPSRGHTGTNQPLQLLGAVCPTGYSVDYILSFFWNGELNLITKLISVYNSLSYVYFPYSLMATPFRHFFAWINPLRYYYSALLLANLTTLHITCKDSELTLFDAPSGQTCGDCELPLGATADY
jgi:ATP-binding cassette subfamily G (WHITE) protein 2 (SNQ2)